MEVGEDMCSACHGGNGRDWQLCGMRGLHVLLVCYLDMDRCIGGMDICEWRVGSNIMACASRVNENVRGGA